MPSKVGSDRIIDEMIFKCLHTSVCLVRSIRFVFRTFNVTGSGLVRVCINVVIYSQQPGSFLPGIPPTGKPLEIAMVGVIAFRGGKLFFE